MATAQNKPQAVREQLERVLSSACFTRSERVSKLLRFLVERRLEDRESELKESIIGGENPQIASYVKTLSRLAGY